MFVQPKLANLYFPTLLLRSYYACLLLHHNLLFIVCTKIKNTWKERRHVRTQSTTLLSLFFHIYNCLVAHLYHFLTCIYWFGGGVVALDTDFSGTKILQVGVFPPLPENFFCLSVLEKLQCVSHAFSGSLHESLFSILNWICMWKQITLRQLQCQLIKKLLHC